MRLLLIAAAVLFVLAGLVASFSGISLAIGAVAWIAWGLLALTLDFLYPVTIGSGATVKRT